MHVMIIIIKGTIIIIESVDSISRDGPDTSISICIIYYLKTHPKFEIKI